MNACHGRNRIGWSSCRNAGEYTYAMGSVQSERAYGSASVGNQ